MSHLGISIRIKTEMASVMTEKDKKSIKEQKRQAVLLRHATNLYLNEDMTLNYAKIVYDNVKELLDVTKINKSLAVSFLNTAMKQGQDGEQMVHFSDALGRISHYVMENCCECGKEQIINGGLCLLEEDENGATCLINYQWFICKKKWEDYDTANGERKISRRIARKKHLGLCKSCVPKDVVCYKKDLDKDDEDLELWEQEK